MSGGRPGGRWLDELWRHEHVHTSALRCLLVAPATRDDVAAWLGLAHVPAEDEVRPEQRIAKGAVADLRIDHGDRWQCVVETKVDTLMQRWSRQLRNELPVERSEGPDATTGVALLLGRSSIITDARSLYWLDKDTGSDVIDEQPQRRAWRVLGLDEWVQRLETDSLAQRADLDAYLGMAQRERELHHRARAWAQAGERLPEHSSSDQRARFLAPWAWFEALRKRVERDPSDVWMPNRSMSGELLNNWLVASRDGDWGGFDLYLEFVVKWNGAIDLTVKAGVWGSAERLAAARPRLTEIVDDALGSGAGWIRGRQRRGKSATLAQLPLLASYDHDPAAALDVAAAEIQRVRPLLLERADDLRSAVRDAP